jgi:hypothetical protein
MSPGTSAGPTPLKLHADNEALAARLVAVGWTVERDMAGPTRAPHLAAWHLPDPEAEVLVARDDAAIGPLEVLVGGDRAHDRG